MIARGSTRLTVPVMSSPSRLANWSKTWSRSTSRMRWRTICLAVCAPIRPKTSPSSCSVSTRSPRSASGWMACACSTVISVNSSSISSTTRRARKTRILPVSASIRTWMSSSPATRRYADWMPSSTAPMSCSREICFSALSWRRAPTKSRLTMTSVRCADVHGDAQKETWGSPTSRSGRSVAGSIHPGAWTAQRRAGAGRRGTGVATIRHATGRSAPPPAPVHAASRVGVAASRRARTHRPGSAARRSPRGCR